MAPPAISFGQPPAGVAPPPMMPGSLGGRPMSPGGVAPPPIISAPPMMTPGSLSGPPPMMSGAPAANLPKVLVGFMVTFQNDPAGTFWPIHSGRTQLGRSAGEGIDIALQDASASSRHASIHADPATGQAFVEDDGSRNGTFLNEARLASGERRQLRDNDRLRLGSTTFVVKLLVS
jgi:FHA domain